MGLDAWEVAYRQHPVWASVKAAAGSLDACPEVTSDDERSGVDRIRFVLGYLREQGENSLILVPRTSLDASQQAVSTIQTQLDQWIATGDVSYLTDASGPRVEALLDALRGWPVSKDRYAKGIIAAADGYVAAAQVELDRLREQAAGLKGELTTLTETLEINQAAAVAAAAAVQTQVAEVEQATGRQVLRLDEALNGLQSTFAAAENARAEAHLAALAEQLAAETEARRLTDEQTVTARARWEKDAELTLAALGGYKAQAENLVNAVGLAGTSTEYCRYAEQERKSADVWRYVAAGSFGLAFVVFVLMLLAGFGGHINEDTPWQLVVFKVTGSAGLLALGYYSARESGSHRAAERAAKNIQLDLAALEPFIANMPEEQKREVRLGAARRLFVTPPSSQEQRDGVANSGVSAGDMLVE